MSTQNPMDWFGGRGAKNFGADLDYGMVNTYRTMIYNGDILMMSIYFTVGMVPNENRVCVQRHVVSSGGNHKTTLFPLINGTPSPNFVGTLGKYSSRISKVQKGTQTTLTLDTVDKNIAMDDPVAIIMTLGFQDSNFNGTDSSLHKVVSADPATNTVIIDYDSTTADDYISGGFLCVGSDSTVMHGVFV